MNETVSAPIVIGWQVGVPSGWGTYGLNLAVQLSAKGIDVGLPFLAQTLNVTHEQNTVLKSALNSHEHYKALSGEGDGRQLSSTFLRALGDGLDFPPFLDPWLGRPDIGVVFFESANIPQENVIRAAELDAVIAGSSWNADVLKSAGLKNVFNCPQGIDPTLFYPGEKTSRFGDRFTVFSGGKLEYRKGQDLVIAAFKRFYAEHPEALLVTAWHNPWPEAAASLSASPHVETVPGSDAAGNLDVAAWLRTEGLPADSFVDLGLLANGETPSVLRDMDVALFPNRCEGGTNLVAMEAMACGVPSIVSRNTGHLDLFGDDTCIGIDLQIPLGEVTGRKDLEGWGESSIEELVQKLEIAFSDSERRKTVAANGARFMAEWSWSAQVDRLLEVVGKVS
ncbi:MAG: glycosyltransferase [Alphaproteobacteria bacterium]|nr:glycosyltransferase [Alphaproteobacteria bacterium]